MKEWKWKSTIIDFNAISDEKSCYCDYLTKKQEVFHYLGIPDDDIHEWENGKYSSEYNTALRYAKELGLIEDYIDYEEIRFQNSEKDKEIERLNKELMLKTDFIEELLTIISVARDYELHDKCYTRSRIYQDKLKELKEGK